MKLTQKKINKLRETYIVKRKDYIIKVVHRCMNCVIKQIKSSAKNGEDTYVFSDGTFYKLYNKEMGFGCIQVDLMKGIN